MSNQIEKELYYDLQDSLGECGNGISYEAYMARCNEVNLKVASIPVNYDRFEIQEGRNAIRLKALGLYQVGTVNYWEQKRELYDDGGKLVDEGHQWTIIYPTEQGVPNLEFPKDEWVLDETADKFHWKRIGYEDEWK